MPSIDLWTKQKANEQKVKNRRNSIIRKLADKGYGPSEIALNPKVLMHKSSVSRIIRLGKNVNFKR